MIMFGYSWKDATIGREFIFNSQEKNVLHPLIFYYVFSCSWRFLKDRDCFNLFQPYGQDFNSWWINYAKEKQRLVKDFNFYTDIESLENNYKLKITNWN